jgi:hypothetical protein
MTYESGRAQGRAVAGAPTPATRARLPDASGAGSRAWLRTGGFPWSPPF